MHFQDMWYVRPDFHAVSARYEALLNDLAEAKDKAEFVKSFQEINGLRSVINTMSTLTEIRHTINTKDAFFDQENDYWDETRPKYEVLDSRLKKIAVNCPFRKELEPEIPETFFQLAECDLNSFSEEIVPLVQKENKLVSEYGKLKASAEIPFNGETYNLSTIAALSEDPDESVRKGSMDARLKFYEDHEDDFDRIFDELVSVRTEMAIQLGYRTYTELAYQRMNRIDYDAEMVSAYRKEILREIVPIASKLYARQARRLGKETVSYFNKSLEYLSGNPKPQLDYDGMIENAAEMYHEMSEETGLFFDMMRENELFDLLSRDGKELGGYCTSIPGYKSPFIFANFNGTSQDVNVLTHEAGHAFQYWMSRHIPCLDVQWPTMESAEIASMSMEFNAWPWMSHFFKEETEKYRFLHLSSTLKFLPYGILVDHFQHEVYDHPDWTKEERKQCWRKLEQMYQPALDYSGAPLLERGGWWYQQGHIFQVPFYYIDYTLAQVCALQFWARQDQKDPEAWNDYVTLCSLGGTKSFTGLVKAANLKSPFEEGCLKETAERADKWLSGIDDSAF